MMLAPVCPHGDLIWAPSAPTAPHQKGSGTQERNPPKRLQQSQDGVRADLVATMLSLSMRLLT